MLHTSFISAVILLNELAASLDLFCFASNLTTRYQVLGLKTYFTTGEKETRAWTIVSGMTAPQVGVEWCEVV